MGFWGALFGVGGAEFGTELIEAAKAGDTEKVKRLLVKGADVNGTDEDGETALMFASHRRYTGYRELVKTLLNKGADVNTKDKHGETALMRASVGGCTETVMTLIEKGADVNVKDENGWTALMRASQAGHTEIVITLIEKGAAVNAKNNDRESALMWAYWRGNRKTVKTLIDKGADENATDKHGRTALMYASNTKIISLLKEVGTKHEDRKQNITFDGKGGASERCCENCRWGGFSYDREYFCQISTPVKVDRGGWCHSWMERPS